MCDARKIARRPETPADVEHQFDPLARYWAWYAAMLARDDTVLVSDG
jgi:hypothetical protein